MTKQEFDLKYRGEKVAVHCDTEEKAKAFLSLAKSFGYKWVDIYKNEVEITYWDMYGKETCYTIDVYDKAVTSHIGWYKDKGYTIVDFELDEPNGYAIEDTPSPMKETFKIGDVVYNKDGNKLTITNILYKTNDFGYYEANELSHQKPLKEITEKELADMGFVIKK